jgi:hypothetical protein
VSPPELRWNELIESYELRGFRVKVAGEPPVSGDVP